MQTWLGMSSGIFLQHVLVGHPVDERHQDVQARRQGAVVLAQPLDHPGVLLRHDLDATAMTMKMIAMTNRP